jgi:hypothetical protein
MLTKPFSALALLALLGASAAMPRDAAADSPRGRDGVCVYEHAEYQGRETCFGVGDTVRDLGNLRDTVSSIRVYGRARITVFEHPQFGGREVTIDEDVPDMRRINGWNDEVDSLRVTGDHRFEGPRDQPDRGDRDRICIYEHANFGGNSQCFSGGEDLRELNSIGWNDRISSIRVFGRSRVVVWEHSNFQGKTFVIDRDIEDLNEIHFNDAISSLRVPGGRGDDRRRRW